MPLPILLALVIGGIAGIALLLHVLGYSHRARLRDADAARSIWADRFPKSAILDITLSEDKTAALIRSHEGPGVVWAMGSDFVARDLTPDRFSLNERRDAVILTTADRTAPQIHLTLSAAERAAWYSVLGEPHR